MKNPEHATNARISAVLAKYAAADPVGSSAVPDIPVVRQCTGDRRAPGIAPGSVPPCSRWEQRYALYQWLYSFPPESIQRLAAVNNAAGSAKHVLLALAFGMYDQHVRKLNGVIIGLQVRRLRAERTHDAQVIESIQQKLGDLHHAIDWITGTTPLFSEREGEIAACNRLKGEAA
jgi:hypothetical protein